MWLADLQGDGSGLDRGLLPGLVVRSKDIWIGKPSLNECFLVLEVFSRGFLFMKCLSTHLSIVRTESVEGKRRSAAVLMMFELAIRKVAAIPRSACKESDQSRILCLVTRYSQSSRLRQ